MNDYDVDDFSTGGKFIKKDELKATGSERKKIQSVERRLSQPDKNGKPVPELVLIFSDETKLGLRAQTNRDELRAAFGRHTSAWIGKVIELYVDPSVRNPSGARVGGIRIRVPGQDGEPVDFRSDLDESESVNEGDVPF